VLCASDLIEGIHCWMKCILAGKEGLDCSNETTLVLIEGYQRAEVQRSERRGERESSSLLTEVLEPRIGCERDGCRPGNKRGMGSRRGANVFAEGAKLRRARDKTDAFWRIV
jgi:hypothetical protein